MKKAELEAELFELRTQRRRVAMMAAELEGRVNFYARCEIPLLQAEARELADGLRKIQAECMPVEGA